MKKCERCTRQHCPDAHRFAKYYWWIYRDRAILRMGISRRNAALNRWIKWAYKQHAQLAYVYEVTGEERTAIIKEENLTMWENKNA